MDVDQLLQDHWQYYIWKGAKLLRSEHQTDNKFANSGWTYPRPNLGLPHKNFYAL